MAQVLSEAQAGGGGLAAGDSEDSSSDSDASLDLGDIVGHHRLVKTQQLFQMSHCQGIQMAKGRHVSLFLKRQRKK